MRKYIASFLGVLCLSGIVFGETDIAAPLHQLAQQAITQASSNLSAQRFHLMRYYPPRDTVYEAPGAWSRLVTSYTDSHERALAFYLFNMYMSAKTYRVQQVPSVTFNFVGVLDALARQTEPFETKEAEKFYQKHKQEVRARIKEFYEVHHWQYVPNEDFELACVRALAKAPLRNKLPGYTRAQTNLVKGTISREDENQLLPVWNQAKNASVRDVITFENSTVSLQDYDSRLYRPGGKTQYTYRWVREECNYSSYVLGKQLVKTYLNDKTHWGHLRIYMLTAKPQTGTYLKPATGARFKLANGKTASKWQYHTALLVVTNFNRTYTPVIMDSFLGGSKLMTLDEWLINFAPDTVFFAEPFFRDKAVEDAIKTATNIDHDDRIFIDGKVYTPAPIED